MEEQTKRHCMVVHAYYPLGEVRVQREAEALIDFGYQVDVICLRLPGESAQDCYNGVNIFRLPVRRHKGKGIGVQFIEYVHFFIWVFFKLTSLHIKHRYDVVQVHNPPDFLVFAALIPKLSGTSIILDLHDLMPEFFSCRFNGSSDRLLVRLMIRLVNLQERWACRFADHVITVTEHWRQTLIRRNVPADKTFVLMNLADPRIFKIPSQPKPRAEGQFHLIYHGSIPYRYGLDLVLRAIAQIRAQVPEIHFTIIGGGDYMGHLRALADKLGIEEHVSFEGVLLVDELPERIVAADLGVVPYRNDVFTDELLPTKLLEYAALGLPVIASRTMGILAYFDDTMVQFFTPGDVDDLARCILVLYQDRTRLAALAENIERFNQRYNWETQSAEYVGLVERLVQRKQRGV